jgi:NAD(P)-dependent dehydrogenase (short-subunit alcohol dehydrogenase family)
MSRILIAGATSGIGAALLDALREEGHQVLGCARRIVADRREEVCACDITNAADVRRLLEWLPPSLDALIVTAGGFGAIGPLETTDEMAWWRTLRTHVLGLYYLARGCKSRLLRGQSPRVITFSGGGAFGPFPRYSAYATAKAGVVRLTECLAAEWAPTIAVNAVAPGMVDTPIHEQTRAAGREQAGTQYDRRASVAMDVPVACVRWLLSHDADGITGRTIAANFDPWRAPGFAADLRGDPERYTLRRTEAP